MIRRIGDYALSSALFSPTIPLLYDVTRDSPDDEFQEFLLVQKNGTIGKIGVKRVKMAVGAKTVKMRKAL